MNIHKNAIMLLLAAASLGCHTEQPVSHTEQPAGHKRLALWLGDGFSANARAQFVNRYFTNGTPMKRVVAALGTNYTVYTAVSEAVSDFWVGPGPEPSYTAGLIYDFGDDCVTISTTATAGAEPETGNFIGAGFSFGDPERQALCWIMQKECTDAGQKNTNATGTWTLHELTLPD
jgi:hypothetical protein